MGCELRCLVTTKRRDEIEAVHDWIGIPTTIVERPEMLSYQFALWTVEEISDIDADQKSDWCYGFLRGWRKAIEQAQKQLDSSCPFTWIDNGDGTYSLPDVRIVCKNALHKAS